jgi:hypothetical protein
MLALLALVLSTSAFAQRQAVDLPGVTYPAPPPAAPAPGAVPPGAALPGIQPGAVPGASAGGNSTEDSAAELIRIHDQQKKAYQQLNNLNPFSAEYQKDPAGAAAATGPLAQITQLLAQPAVQGYLRFFQNPVFAEAIDQILKSPRRNIVLYSELGWIVFMLLLRTWRMSRSTRFFAHLWTNFWTFALFWGGAAAAVPAAILGAPYVNLVTSAVSVLTAPAGH